MDREAPDEQSQMDDPAVLSCAPRNDQAWQARRRLFRRAVGVAILLVLAALLESGLDFGQSLLSCSNCGAHCQVRHFALFGRGGRYGWTITEGPVSRVIQAYDRQPCTHRWELADGEGGGLLSHWLGQGVGLCRFSRVTTLEQFQGLSARFLDRKARSDPEFAAELKWAIQDPLDPDRDRWLLNLVDELYEFTMSQPAL